MAEEQPKISESWTSFLGNLSGAAQGPTQQVYREWERWLGAQVERLAGNPQFIGQIGRALGKAGAFKPFIDHAVGAALKGRGDKKTAELEARVASLEAQVAKLKGEAE